MSSNFFHVRHVTAEIRMTGSTGHHLVRIIFLTLPIQELDSMDVATGEITDAEM